MIDDHGFKSSKSKLKYNYELKYCQHGGGGGTTTKVKIMIDNYSLLKAMNLVKILFKNLYG